MIANVQFSGARLSRAESNIPMCKNRQNNEKAERGQVSMRRDGFAGCDEITGDSQTLRRHCQVCTSGFSLLALALDVVPSLSLGAAALLVLVVIHLALVVADAGLGGAAPGGVGAAVVEDASCLNILVVGVWVG